MQVPEPLSALWGPAGKLRFGEAALTLRVNEEPQAFLAEGLRGRGGSRDSDPGVVCAGSVLVKMEIRKVVQSLEQTAREILTLLQGVHQGAGFQDIPKRCLKAREHFGTTVLNLSFLRPLVPQPMCLSFRRFHEHWRFVLQRLVFLAAFVVYLESETLVTREAVTEILGIEPDREKGFHLDVEDYLSGVLILASELSRLSVNSVTAGDYSRPLHISTFINELDSGFRLLNLKNDSLRKRYDGLKYDVKKVEEVVYDLSIRGFNKETAAACVEK
ncbi:PREDICTED: translin [Myotis davidii]|uniref:translin n=1 Tax=Myotis davidii TaxID=225400 RepID=UPI00076706C0|nr:PREDICTED: translin [Myotis davidii]